MTLATMGGKTHKGLKIKRIEKTTKRKRKKSRSVDSRSTNLRCGVSPPPGCSRSTTRPGFGMAANAGMIFNILRRKIEFE